MLLACCFLATLRVRQLLPVWLFESILFLDFWAILLQCLLTRDYRIHAREDPGHPYRENLPECEEEEERELRRLSRWVLVVQDFVRCLVDTTGRAWRRTARTARERYRKRVGGTRSASRTCTEVTVQPGESRRGDRRRARQSAAQIPTGRD